MERATEGRGPGPSPAWPASPGAASTLTIINMDSCGHMETTAGGTNQGVRMSLHLDTRSRERKYFVRHNIGDNKAKLSTSFERK